MKKIKKCIIPAAGFGTRFLPATKALPKEMFPILDKPVMQYLVEEAVEAGCEDIIIVTGRNKRAIEDHFDANFELENALEKSGKNQLLETVKNINTLANISYVRQPYPRGDGDAILRVKNIVWDEPVLVLFWDDLIFWKPSASQQLVDFFHEYHSPVIAAIEVLDDEVHAYGILEGDKKNDIIKISKFIEKPSAQQTVSRNAAIGKYIITPDVISELEILENQKNDGEIKLADAFWSLLEKNKNIYWLRVSWERFDAGSKLWYIKATLYQALRDSGMKQEILDMIKKYC